jgi:hypothetical protein
MTCDARSRHVVAALLLAAVAALASSPLAAQTCAPVVPSLRPNWTVSGAWDADGQNLYLIDAGANKILRYSPTGRALGPVTGAVSAALGGLYPRVLRNLGSDLLLEVFHGKMIQLDRSFVPVSPMRTMVADHSSEAVRAGATVETLWLWEPAGDQDLITCSDVKETSGLAGQKVDWRIAFLRIPLANPAHFTVLGGGWDFRDPINLFCRLGLPYAAALGDTAFILAMEESPRIYRNEKGSADLEPLEAKPPSFGRRPDLPESPTKLDYHDLMQSVEQAKMPAGLFGWKNDLYVLNRKPAGDGSTQWSISKIDPRQDRLVGTAPLRSNAHHLTVIPGPDQWAFVEKGVANGLGDQEVESLFFVPASAFTNLRDGIPLCQ